VQRPGVLAILGLGAVALVLLVRRGTQAERTGALPPAVVALVVLVGPVVASLVGANLVASRNVIAAWPLAAIVAGAGLGAAGARRIGAALALALCAIMLAIDVAVPLDERLQRDDWEELVALVRPLGREEVVAVLRGFDNSRVAYYLPGGGEPPAAGAVRVRDLYVVGHQNTMAAFLTAAAGVGFTPVRQEANGTLRLALLRAPSPVALPARDAFGQADVIVRGRE